MSDFCSFSTGEKTPSSEHLSLLSPAVDGKLAFSLYLFESLYRRALSTSSDAYETSWRNFAKEPRVQVWLGNDSTTVNNKDTISISQVLNEALSAGEALFLAAPSPPSAAAAFLSRTAPLPNARDIVVDEFVRDT